MSTSTVPRPSRPFGIPALALAVLTGALLLALPQPAAACSCVPPPPPAEALEGADAVFSGTVVSVDNSFRDSDYGRIPQRRVAVELDRVWKGCEAVEGEERPRRVELVTGSGGGDCGYDFQEGERYLVYAHEGSDGTLTTGICSRTANLENATDDLAALGEPEHVFPEK